MPSLLQVKSNLESSAKAAIESKDYLSYAQVIDQNLSPCQFDVATAGEALDCLTEILDTDGYEELCYHIGWDLPELIMLYVDEFSHGPSGEPDHGLLKALSKLGNIICLKSNPKELFLKVCELMRDVDTFSEAEDVDLESENADYNKNARFCLLFEMLRYSMNRIVTPYPTRFIKMANSVLLEVANSRTSITGVITVLRRIFIFARDFDMDLFQVSEEEKSATRHLLISLLTYGCDVSLQNYSLKWTERLYYQMTNKVSTSSSPEVRSSSYNLSLYTARLEDAVTRCSQLVMSYDMDPIASMMDYIKRDDNAIVHSYSLRPKGDDNATLDYLLAPSLLGTFFMYSQICFMGPTLPKLDLSYSIKKAIYCRKHCPMTAGMRDAMLYWALSVVSRITPEDIEEVSCEELGEYIKTILSVAGESKILNERCIAFCISGKVLAKLEPDESVGIMLDAIRTSYYPHILDAGVQILKSLLLGTKGGSGESCFIKEFVGMTTRGPNVSPGLKREVALTAEKAADDIISGNAQLSSYILSWINLLHVVETDPVVVERLRVKLRQYLETNTTCNNCQVIKIALDNLGAPKSTCSFGKVFKGT